MNPVPSWKTNVGFTILGILADVVVGGVSSAMHNVAGIVVVAVYAALAIWYALSQYPAFFSEAGVDNPKSVSFLNGFFGGIIFGCLWNSNLTKGQKGVSNIVFTIITAVSLLALVGGFFLS